MRNGRGQARCWTAFLCAVMLTGCAQRENVATGSVAAVWQQQDRVDAKPAGAYRERSPADREAFTQGAEVNEPIIATVNGRPIARRLVIDLLIQSRGVGVLEQLIGLETAATALAEKGLTVTQVDVDREHDRALRDLTEPLSSVTPEPFDREAAERVLEQVLAQRNMSRREFDIITRRNAYLRKIVESQQVITEAQLRREFQRVCGERVQVHHIQLGTLAEVERVKERLAAGGDFAELAGRYSANTTSAQNQGLLDPFSAEDEQVPALLREVAFSLAPGEVSSAVRVGQWYHLLKLEKRLPAETSEFEEVRHDLERSLRERLAGPAMYELFERLFREATIRIHDPDLAKAFNSKHSDRRP